MKPFSFWMFMLSVPIFGLAQSSVNLEQTFYDLPIDDSRLKIKRQIISDERFSEKPKTDSSLFDIYKNIYYGNIVRHNIPTQFQIDSATIELTFGYGMFTKAKSKGRELTFIKLQYYVPNIAASNALSLELWNRLKNISSDTSNITVGRKEDNNFSYGRQIKIKRKKYLPRISILQQEYNTAIFLVRIEYERFGE